MSTGGGLGALFGMVLGAVFSVIIPGLTTVMGIYLGAVIGYTVGNIIDPATPDVKQVGCPLQGLQITSNETGSPIPDALGTVKIAGFLMAYGGEFAIAETTEAQGGKGGGSKSQPQVTGHRYYMSWALGICKGPLDTLYTIYGNEKVFWEGELNRPISGGQETIVIENFGTMIFYFGTDDHVANAKMGAILPDATLNSPLRNLCWAFFDACYIGNFNRLPTMFFSVKKKPVLSFSVKNEISTYDYNPMHAMWYILHELAGLPETWLHSGDFAIVANTLFAEGRGISILLQQYQAAQTYLESIGYHADAILRYDSDGTFHPKLLRNDYNPALLPLVDESVVLEEPTIVRKSWIDTINEVKVQYSELVASVPFQDYLIGHYPFSDGSGLVAKNQTKGGKLGGGALKDLTIIDAKGNFWSYLSGFGSTPSFASLGENIAYVDGGVTRVLGGIPNGGCGLGIFYRGVSIPAFVGYQYCLFNISSDNLPPAGSNTASLCPTFDSVNYIERLYWKITSAYNLDGSPPGQWCFIFIDDQYYICLVRADGTLKVGQIQSTMMYPINFRWVIVGAAQVVPGVGGVYGAMGSYGDFFIYNRIALTRTDWATVYDRFRGRYGMSPRNW